MEKKQLLFSSVVSHGRNSGGNYATSFSNQNGSYKSSLGFYLTENTYQGGNGYSLILNGLEKGINDKAKERSIVVHGASYANPTVAASGRLGRSLGCPALPTKLAKPIINTIKDGSVMFIYANNSSYLAQSDILKNVSAPCRTLNSLYQKELHGLTAQRNNDLLYRRVNQKQEPFSGSLSTPISPPNCSTILRQMESPSLCHVQRNSV